MIFRQALEGDYSGAFSEVVFAITEWSPERRFLGPFRDVFAVDGNAQEYPGGEGLTRTSGWLKKIAAGRRSSALF
jgi:hypothetical protein